MRVDVLICTFRRPFLQQTLDSLARQVLPTGTALAVIVADNDTTPTAQALVERLQPSFPHPLSYVHAPACNISVARNACLDQSRADWIAFLDDDETAPPGWIAALVQAALGSGADAVFAPAQAIYPDDAPDWMARADTHSNRPERRGGRVLTGHTCNAILRWQGTRWQGLRFDPARGLSGGEDTAFFFAAARLGARFEATETAPVHEPVTAARLTLGWLARRRYRMGQSYASSQTSHWGQVRLAATAVAKAGVCGVMTVLTLPVAARRNFWVLRGCLHAGVVAGCLSLPEPQSYGR